MRRLVEPRLPSAPANRPMAFLSDVHGNLPALEAVLKDLERRAVRDVYVAGDLLFGGDHPLEVWRLLTDLDAKCVRGTADDALVHVDPSTLQPANDREREMAERFAWTRDAVGDLVVEQLKRLPEQRRIPLIDGSEIMMVHGAPADRTVAMTHDMSDEELLALVADDPADVIVCGASHVPFERNLDGLYVINVGTVGEAPSGERVANFSVLTPAMDGTRAEHAYVEY